MACIDDFDRNKVNSYISRIRIADLLGAGCGRK